MKGNDKPSKLREKPTRLPSIQLERKGEVIRAYLGRVAQRPELSEYARGVAFVQLLKDLLLEADPQFLQDYLAGMEHSLAGLKTALYNRGRVDALYGNLVIEFKRSLAKSLDDAKDQLRKYLAILLSKPDERQRPLIGMATDGIQIVAFAPRFSTEASSLTPEDISLVEIESANLDSMSPEEAYYWLDRYFTRQTGPIKPRTKQIVDDFGPTSGSFIHAMNVLGGVWKSLENDSESQVFYDSWQKYLRITYGGPVAETELFLRHTYLATLAKLMVWVRLTGATEPPAEKELRSILNGQYFSQRGIQNFLEEDFFAWVARDAAWPQALTMSRRLLLQLATYNLRELSEDVLKGLYERLVDPKDRHDLGEYYTPDWLAARIVAECLKEKPDASVLDPACGSGTFLYQTILFKREKLGDSVSTLQHIEGNVVGLDIHPLAVIVAKTTYLLGLGDLLERRTEVIRIPVYLSDSIRLREEPMSRRSRKARRTESFRSGFLPISLNGDEVEFPEDLALSGELYDRAIELCAEYAHSTAKSSMPSEEELNNYVRRGQPALVQNAVWARAVYDLFKVLRKKIRERKDTIWAFVLKNIFKPLLLRRRFEVLVGNPPWLSYNQIERGDYQQFVKELVVEHYNICQSRLGLLTQLELGTLFFVRCPDLYLKAQGKIGFVLPRSIFSADQHSHLREGKFKGSLKATQIWDLENVDPLFRVPACAMFAEKAEGETAPLPCLVFEGKLPEKNAAPSVADSVLRTQFVDMWVVKKGKRSYYSASKKDDSLAVGGYLKKFVQGAVIYPRSFWFVRVLSSPQLGFDSRRPLIESAPDAVKRAKKAYQGLHFRGNVESEFLYATLLSTDLVPFGYTRLRALLLPVAQGSEGIELVQAAKAREKGFLGLAEWIEATEDAWAKVRGDKALKEGGIVQRLDYIHQLTKQKRRLFTVVYPKSATNMCACLVRNNDHLADVMSPGVNLRGFIAHGEVYYFDTDNEDEALYLCSYLNSPRVDTALKPLQSKGLFGPRDVHKKVLELGLEEFQSTNPGHNKLSELARTCETEVASFLASQSEKIIFGSVGRLRAAVRSHLREHLTEIDTIIGETL